MNRLIPIPICGLLFLAAAAQAQVVCPAGTLWEPYSEVCAEVRDVQGEYLSALQLSTAFHSDAPVPGTMTTGTAYAPDQLVANDSGRLHTRMFVYPDGLERDAPLPSWLYTTATSRVDNGLEVVAMYTESQDTGSLGLFAWTCLPDFPCPDGATFPDWQWSRPLPQFTCNITQIVDQGGHAQKQLYYANNSDRIDDGSPPLWRSAVYLWNYCDVAWDLVWEHVYRQDKTDCSNPGTVCGWWGPSVEIFGDAMYPQIGEIGYEDSLLYHDGTWSRLLPPEAEFRDPANPAWGSQTPWQLFHLEPNRSYGIGNWFNVNDAPVIEDQATLTTDEGEPLTIDTSLLTISDADIDPVYHVDFVLTVYGGNNYTYSNGELTPDAGFAGTLVVPISVNDGAAESATYDLVVQVGQTTVVPVIQGQVPLQTPEDQSIVINIDDLIVDYPGNDVANLSVIVHAGQSYSFAGTTVTPLADFSGVLSVPVTVIDGVVESNVFDLSITVVPVNDAPSINGQHPLQTLERTPIEITAGDLLLFDPDNDLSELSVRVLDGADYQHVGNTVTPEPGVLGVLVVKIVASDGELDSDVFDLLVEVTATVVPVIQGQVSLQTLEDQSIVISIDDLIVDYPGNDVANLTVVVHAGQSYSFAGTTVTPLADFSGVLSVPVTAIDGVVESNVFGLSISVIPVNDAPSINGQHPLQTLERTPIEITAGDLLLFDPDNDLSELSVRVLDGAGYQRVGNTVTPELDIIGVLVVRVVASDDQLDSDTFDLSVQVIADSVPPEISLIGSAAISVRLGNPYTDAGASASDNVDGDISDRIVVDNPVNTGRAGTYTITYSVEDIAGNAAVVTRTVVVEVAAPVARSSGGGGVSILLLVVLAAFAFHTGVRNGGGMGQNLTSIDPFRDRVSDRSLLPCAGFVPQRSFADILLLALSKVLSM